MKHVLPLVIFSFVLLPGTLHGQMSRKDFQELSTSSCIHCHDADTETGLDLDAIGFDLGDAGTFRQWERIFDRVASGEMPPASEDRPDPKQLKTALASLGKDLQVASLARQEEFGRVPSRRLSRQEYEHTLHDLLGIGGDIAR